MAAGQTEAAEKSDQKKGSHEHPPTGFVQHPEQFPRLGFMVSRMRTPGGVDWMVGTQQRFRWEAWKGWKRRRRQQRPIVPGIAGTEEGWKESRRADRVAAFDWRRGG